MEAVTRMSVAEERVSDLKVTRTVGQCFLLGALSTHIRFRWHHEYIYPPLSF